MFLFGCSNEQLEAPRLVILFDEDWKFCLGDIPGAESVTFDDKAWRVLDLPHDWSIEDLPGTESPLDPDAIGGISSGYFTGGTGWYRKTFKLPEKWSGKRLYLRFDGIYMDADIWINGEHLGNHPYGYTSFWHDVTPVLSPGETNLVAVRVRNEGKNSRWYSGSGIYRHVWLTITEPFHVAQWGSSVTTPVIEEGRAMVQVSNELINHEGKQGPVKVVTKILDSSGNRVASKSDQLDPGGMERINISQELELGNPELWSPDSPVLYTAVTMIEDAPGGLLDSVSTRFGIRSIAFSTNGFFLNGENTLLRGACMHHDNGPLGAAAFDRAEERRVELMKASGFNSIRCAHNPPSPAFLEACDRLGILVIDEAFDMWKRAKNPQDYHRFFEEWWKKDVKSMVLRDRNHPSIIMWSTGNEIPERGEPEGAETSAKLADFIHELDPTRPVTAAVNGLGPDKDPYFATLDISGYNYSFGGDHGQKSIFEIDHMRIPERVMYCAESYPLTAFGAWMDALDHPYVIGDFVWTGFDYLGESSIGWRGYPHEGSFYPWSHAYCGDIDICGIKRPQSYYRNVLWRSGRQLSIFVTPPVPTFEENPDRKDWSKWHWQDVVDRWNWPGIEGDPLIVEVYSAYPEVELFLNGASLGKKPSHRGTQWIARWMVPYTPGELKAVAYREGREAEVQKLVTADDPELIILSADRTRLRASGQDLSFILVELQDGEGNRNTMAENLVEFEISGPGSIAAVGNSNPMSTESFQQPWRKSYRGRCLVIVRSSKQQGRIKLTASSAGMETATLEIETY
jgi:beta-galactosidase